MYASGFGPTIAFDLASGAEVRRFEGLGALALNPDGRTIAIRTAEDRIGLVDTATGRQHVELVGHGAAVLDAAFSADGTMLASVGNDEKAIVWDVATGELRHELGGPTGSVLSVDFSADGSELYTAGADGSLIAWDLDRTRGLAHELVGPSGSAERVGLQLSPTGDVVLIAGDQGTRLLDVNTGKVTYIPSFRSIFDTTAIFAPDGKSLAMVGEDGEVRRLDPATGQLLSLRIDPGAANLGAIAYTPDGRDLVVADGDSGVTEFDAETLDPTGRTLELNAGARTIQATIDGVVAVTSSEEDHQTGTEVVFADLDDGRVLHRVEVPTRDVRANFSTDGRWYAFGGSDGTVGVIDVATGEHHGSGTPLHQGQVAWVTFSPDGETLASVGFDGRVVLSDSATATPRASFQPGPANLDVKMTYSDDGRTVVLAYVDGSVMTYDTDPRPGEAHASCRGRPATSPTRSGAIASGDRPYRETCPVLSESS